MDKKTNDVYWKSINEGAWNSKEEMLKEYDYLEWRKVIYYCPDLRGLRIAAAWIYNEEKHAIEGCYGGYEGGGCYGEYEFLAIFNERNEIIHHYVYDWEEDLVTSEPIDKKIEAYNSYDAPVSLLAWHILQKEYLIADEEGFWPYFIPDHTLNPDVWGGYLNETEHGREYILLDNICPMEVDMYRQVQRNWPLSTRLNDEFLDEEKI